MATPTTPLILASSSPYRRQLLERLQLPFTTMSPDLDETARPGESPAELVVRLAGDKARAIGAQLPHNALVIGSDQVALHQGQVLGKPHTVNRAEAQLAAFSDSEVSFLTGLAVLDTGSGAIQQDLVRFDVGFRPLSATEIARYVALEQPLDCAGAFKSEGLGVRLFRYMRGDDPCSLVGLPLIRLCDMLLAAGLDPLQPGDEERS